MLESEESDSSVLRKLVSEDDEWEEDEVKLFWFQQLIANQLFTQHLILCHIKILVLENSPTLLSH